MEARSLPPQRVPQTREPGAAPGVWRRAATVAVIVGAPWVLIGGAVAAALTFI